VGAVQVVALAGQRTQLVAAAPLQVLQAALQATYLEVAAVVSQKNPVTSVPERLGATQAVTPAMVNLVKVALQVTMVSTPAELKVQVATLVPQALQAATTVASSAYPARHPHIPLALGAEVAASISMVLNLVASQVLQSALVVPSASKQVTCLVVWSKAVQVPVVADKTFPGLQVVQKPCALQFPQSPVAAALQSTQVAARPVLPSGAPFPAGQAVAPAVASR